MHRRFGLFSLPALAVAAAVSQPASADDKTDAYAAIQKWGEAFNAGDVDSTLATYSPGAILFGTISPAPTVTAERMQAYFKVAFANKTQVKLGDFVSAEVSPDTVSISELYDFSRLAADGQIILIPARYSFVLTKKSGAWLIANHHSSLKPRPPARLRTVRCAELSGLIEIYSCAAKIR